RQILKDVSSQIDVDLQKLIEMLVD
ncbi:MAG: hypothetical protein RLZZ89_915, partial [Cyanobacteriota bacterium]